MQNPYIKVVWNSENRWQQKVKLDITITHEKLGNCVKFSSFLQNGFCVNKITFPMLINLTTVFTVVKQTVIKNLKIKYYKASIFWTVSKIVRVIRQPRGNMLLVGIGGSGRSSLTRLASHICYYNVFQIEVSKHYRRQEFRDGKCIKRLPDSRV